MSGECVTQQIRIADILVYPRLRKQTTQIEELAQDISEHGLINPITVMDRGDGSYALIAGQRRLEAVKTNGEQAIRATMLSPMDADNALRLEFAENEQRQDFTVSERLEYAEKIKEIETAKARERKSLHARKGRNEDMCKCPYPEKGAARDVIAKRAGLKNARQYERAVKVSKERPDLMEQVDKGEKTIFGAYKEVVASKQTNAPPHVTDQITRAKHDRLMKNPLYADLCAKHTEAVKTINLTRGECDFKIMGFEKVIRGHEENIAYLRRQIERLKAENAELREKLSAFESDVDQNTDEN